MPCLVITAFPPVGKNLPSIIKGSVSRTFDFPADSVERFVSDDGELRVGFEDLDVVPLGGDG